MNFNPLAIPTLTLALLLFWAGQALYARTPQRRGARIALFTGAALAAGAGLLAGMLSGVAGRFRVMLRPVLLAALIAGVCLPHVKALFAPLRQNQLADRWNGDVCRQSSMSTCGPASAATIFRSLGVAVTEKELAMECHSYAGGTEAWYLARAFRKRGFKVEFRCVRPPVSEIPSPAIAGVKCGDGGHFIAVIGRTPDGGLATGDPMFGRQEFPAARAHAAFEFTGFFMVVHK